MPGVSDYITEIQRYAPYFDASQGNVMNELNRRAAEGATVDQVVNSALGPGGYAENQMSAQNYLKPTYDAQLAGINTQQQQAQDSADYSSKQATTAYDRMAQDIARTYQQRQANDPLARQGIVSGNAQNYQTDLQARTYQQTGEDLQNQLGQIAQALSTTNQGLAGQKSALGEQNAQGVTSLVTNARQALNVANNTPYGTPTDVNGTTVFGRNPNTGILNLLQNPSFSTLLYGAASNPSLGNVLNGVLAPYGINVVNDLGSGSSSSTTPSPSISTQQTSTSTPNLSTPPTPNPTSGGLPTNVIADINHTFQNKNVVTNGGSVTREQIIKQVAAANPNLNPQDIASYVYQNFRSANEPAFNGLSPNWSL